jgi:hypothetical protein
LALEDIDDELRQPCCFAVFEEVEMVVDEVLLPNEGIVDMHPLIEIILFFEGGTGPVANYVFMVCLLKV